MTTHLKRVVHAVRKNNGQVWYSAAYLPKDAPDEKTSPVLRFRPAHTESGHSIDFAAKGIKLKPFRRTVGDRIVVSGWTYAVSRGICDRVRHIPENLLDQIVRLDADIAAKETEKEHEVELLRAERHALLEDAYAHGRKVRVNEVADPI